MPINSTKADFTTLHCNLLAPRECVIVITRVKSFCYFPNKIKFLFFDQQKYDDEGYFSPDHYLGQFKKKE